MENAATFSASGLCVVTLPSLGRGVIAERAFARGEVIAVWRGSTITGQQAVELPADERDQLLQIDADTFLVNDDPRVTVDFINHSCEPNCGFTDDSTLVAMRDIAAGESVTFDYAMSDTNSFIAFECRCETSLCRGRMSGSDWRLPQLQQRYAGWFAPHVARLITEAQESAAAQPTRV
ncbi:MAG: SET domain-containing protein [Ilumatobacteraceae bacterium]